MNCTIYTRVSADPQAEKEFPSCEVQEKIIAFVKTRNNWKVSNVYFNLAYTGGNFNRQGLPELLEHSGCEQFRRHFAWQPRKKEEINFNFVSRGVQALSKKAPENVQVDIFGQ